MMLILKRLAELNPAWHESKIHRLPPGRCACREPTVKWCTRHGRPLKVRPR